LAGACNTCRPERGTNLRDRKVQNIRSVKPDVVAAGNIGCITQLAPAMDIPIVHTVELLHWAYAAGSGLWRPGARAASRS
jgi:glycolate oxidase iron-sulfur subunit